MAIHLDLTSPSGSSSLPEGRASNSIAFCLALLPMRLAMRLLLPVARWSLAPPFHPYRPEGRRSVLCCAISQVTLGGRYPPSCSMEPGSSSADPNEDHGRGHQEVSRPIVARGVTACSGGWRRRLVTKLVLWCGICICDASNPFRLVGKDAVFSTNRGERGRVLPILARTRLQYESYPNGSSRSVRI